MDNDDLEKTQYMGNIENSSDNDSANNEIATKGNVRELKPITLGKENKTAEDRGFFSANKKKIILLLSGFVIAILLGFVLAGMLENYQESKAEERLQKQQEIELREQKLASQEDYLNKERDKITKEKQELEQKKQEILAKSQKIEEKNKELKEEKSKGSLGTIIDKVTGKENERKKNIAENKEKETQLEQEADEIDKSIAEAQATLAEMDERLNDLATLKKEADELKRKAEISYEENKDVIDSIIYYVNKGADLLDSILAKD